jgi:lysophospholipase L1-like esterase
MVLRVAQELKVPFIDVYAHFKDQRRYFADETHFTTEGHLTMAQLVAERIEPLLSIPGRPVCRRDGV